MSPPIRDGSGNSINSIRLGDGSEISEVRTGAGDVLFSGSAIPDSVVHQFVANTWSEGTAWTDQLAGATLAELGDPSEITSALNGNDYISFDGVNDAFEDTTTDITFSQPNGVVFVGRHISGTGNSSGFVTGVNNRQIIRGDNEGSEVFAFAGSNLPASTGTTSTNFEIYNVLFDSTSSNIRLSGNSLVTGDAGTQGLSGVLIGENRTRGNFHEMEIAEMWFMKNPSAQDRDDADAVLADKYGLTL